jgi:hypothetical protein
MLSVMAGQKREARLRAYVPAMTETNEKARPAKPDALLQSYLRYVR